MESRGYTRSDNPDLAINFKGKLEEKTDIESTPAPMYGPGWGYGGWYGAPYGGYGGTEVTTRRYHVGTLVMDVVDRAKRQVVFQGGLETVVSKEMMQNREAAITQAVQHIFSRTSPAHSNPDSASTSWVAEGRLTCSARKRPSAPERCAKARERSDAVFGRISAPRVQRCARA